MADEKTTQNLLGEMLLLQHGADGVREKLATVTKKLKAKSVELGLPLVVSNDNQAEPVDRAGIQPTPAASE